VPKEKKPSEARRIFEALRDPEIENIEFCSGEYLGETVSYAVKIDRKGNAVPIALLLTAKTLKLIEDAANIVIEKLEEEPEDDLDETDDGSDERPARGKRF